MYLARTPALLKPLYHGRVWSIPTKEKVLYLTFDDGPIAGVTPWVLDTLRGHGAHATFFVVGNNAAKHPELLERIREEGHAVGNHTWDHMKGWRTRRFTYLRNVLRTQTITGTSLFRPPYGRITRAQSRALRGRFDVVMWDVLAADFDKRVSKERCLRNVITHARAGSIVVFHDSLKAEPRLRYALPRALEHFANEGYAFKALPMDGITAPRQ